MERERLSFDVVIVGAGPAGLAAAIRLRQLGLERGQEISVCVVEKGAEVGAHILSGAVIEPRAIAELFPDWASRDTPLDTPVTDDRFLLLTQARSVRLPTPPAMRNHGNYAVSLGDVCRWLGREAEALGVELFAGFPAAELLLGADGAVQGVATGEMGRGKDGEPTAAYQPGVELQGRLTFLAEGCRGSLSEQAMARFGLREGVAPQTYALGVKELWEVPDGPLAAGHAIHTIGWPLDRATYGGSWLYGLSGGRVSAGFVVGLDYANPWLSPFEEFQRFKAHPAIRPIFAGGKRLAYGARALNEGGFQAIPKLVFPGGALIGDSAGFLNVPKIKGTHGAMKSGMLAAEAAADALAQIDAGPITLAGYPERLCASWLWAELKGVRNIRPGFRRGMLPGLANAALESFVWRGRAPWTLHHAKDHEALRPAAEMPKIAYPKPDGVLTFDRLSSVYLSNTNHAEDQPAHLVLEDPARAYAVNWPVYAGPEARYCPAGVYEWVEEGANAARFVVNAPNCVHCKTCDIKDPTQNIRWVTPEGGGGPAYPSGM